MREIKFRAWDKSSKRMFPACELVDEKYFRLQTGFNCDHFMQFTGLHDKNSKRIYEGDIVRVDDSADIHWSARNEIAVIKYSPGRFQLSCKNGQVNVIQEDLQDIIEIIGNIHENQELLGR